VRMSLFLFLFCLKAFATDGVVTVLEAPLFLEADEESRVIQWVRKGQKIFLNPEVVQILEEDREGNFYRTLDKSGHEAFILRHHVWVETDDKLELSQTLHRPDTTDYRLIEPLPKKYPFIQPQGYRGSILYSMGTTNPNNYPFNQKINSRQSGAQHELNIVSAKRALADLSDRWYFGGMFVVRSFSQRLVMDQKLRTADEEWYKLGVGPLLMYDIFREDQHRVNIWTAIMLYPYNHTNILQTDKVTNTSSDRSYRSYSMAGRVGINYQRIKIIGDTDFVIGVWFETEMEQTYRFVDGDNKVSFWKNYKGDSFNVPYQFTLAGTIGFQSAY
jgi:hypothetical protein